MKNTTKHSTAEILDYKDGQKVVDFLERPENSSRYFSEEEIDLFVLGRKEWTAATLAILARCNILKEDFDGQKSRYRLQQNIINGTNTKLQKDVQRFFLDRPYALISTIFLCKKFLSNLFLMRDMLFNFKYDGLLAETSKDYYIVSEKYLSLLPRVTKFTDELFGPPIEIPKDYVPRRRNNSFLKIL